MKTSWHSFRVRLPLAVAPRNPTKRANLARPAVHLRAGATNESTAHRTPLADWLGRGPGGCG